MVRQAAWRASVPPSRWPRPEPARPRQRTERLRLPPQAVTRGADGAAPTEGAIIHQDPIDLGRRDRRVDPHHDTPSGPPAPRPPRARTWRRRRARRGALNGFYEQAAPSRDAPAVRRRVCPFRVGAEGQLPAVPGHSEAHRRLAVEARKRAGARARASDRVRPLRDVQRLNGVPRMPGRRARVARRACRDCRRTGVARAGSRRGWMPSRNSS